MVELRQTIFPLFFALDSDAIHASFATAASLIARVTAPSPVVSDPIAVLLLGT